MDALGAKRTSFEKLQRDRAKKAKAAAKREKRLDKTVAPDSDGRDEEAGPSASVQAGDRAEVPTEQVIERVARLQQDFDDGNIAFEEFEERKTELLNQLSVD